MKNQDTNIILRGIGGAAMVVAGVISFFTRAAAVGAISKGLAVAAVIIGIILLVKTLAGLKNGGRFSIDFLIWFAIAFLLSNTPILSSLGGIVVIIIGVMMIIQGITSLRLSFSDGGKTAGGLIVAVLFVMGGGFFIIRSQMIFEEAVGKMIGVYLIIQGISMLRDTIGMAKYERNFKGVE